MAVPLMVNLKNPRIQSLAGNTFWTVTQLTNWDAGHVEFLPGVDGRFYGSVYIPDNIVPGSPTLKLILAANNTTAALNTYVNVAFMRVADAATLNGSFTYSTTAIVSVPTTAYQRFYGTFTANLTTPATGEEYIVEVTRNGASTTDSLTAANLWLYDALLLT